MLVLKAIAVYLLVIVSMTYSVQIMLIYTVFLSHGYSNVDIKASVYRVVNNLKDAMSEIEKYF